MLRFVIPIGLLAFCLSALGQSSNGTITGIITDPAGAVVSGAEIEARNPETGVVYVTVSTSTGNYSIANLPVGTYELSAMAKGFSLYIHTNLRLPAAGILREDVPLKVSPGAEKITVTTEASLLAAGSGDQTTNVTISHLDNLPLLGIGPTNAGSSGIRNPYGLMQLIPGVDYMPNSAMIVNGLGSVFTPTEGFRIEGQDFTNHLPLGASGAANVQYNQPSVDAIQEVAVQTSNYAPEYGTAGAGVINITMKSGTNQYHGTAYEYFVNEALNAGYPFSVNVSGHGKVRPRNRRNDFGGALGGPVYIPKLYNGHNRTFFFWNYEEYIESVQNSPPITVPTPDYLNGNFSKISQNGSCSLCAQYGIQQSQLGTVTDGQGKAIFANTIYDPETRAFNPATNLGYATPFPNNIIPANRFDPVALKLEGLFPAAQNANLANNATGGILASRHTTIPSIKIDEVLTPKDKLSFYYAKTSTEAPFGSNPDGLPLEIGTYVGSFAYQSLYRLNYDRSLTPTLLLHLGIGWARLSTNNQAPYTSFNPSTFGLSGFEIDRQFPSVTGMSSLLYGGMQNIGTMGQNQALTQQEKPTFNANITQVTGRHTYKAGAELYYQGTVFDTFAGVTLATGAGPTALPFIPTGALNGFNLGFGYASFLLGDYTMTAQTPQLNYRLGKYQFAAFLQDSWKVGGKLTLDYGIRYDLAGAPRETYGRLGEFAPDLPNQSAGGHPGATQYASTCKCSFYPSVYPYGIGPRFGVAYQIDPKTVIRGGWGLVYQYGPDGPEGGLIYGSSVNTSPSVNGFVNTQASGFIGQPAWPTFDPNVYPTGGTPGAGVPVYPDRSQNRPPRISQWSAGFQRELSRNLLFEAAYVANRAIWLTGGPGNTLNNISPAQYAQYGLYPYPGTGPAGTNNYSDFMLLGMSINTTAVRQKLVAAGVPYGMLSPYPGYPQTQTLGKTLYPFPQFGPLSNTGIANGKSKYDALQVKATKRLSHGLQVNGTFSWSRAFVFSGRQDFYNPKSSVWDLQLTDQPFLFNMSAVYTTPKAPFLNRIRGANQLVKDWQIAAFTEYGSGLLLSPPTNPTSNLLTSQFYRVAGQPLYTVNLNSHSFNPYSDTVLNRYAWAPVPVNAVGPAVGTLYSDFRGPRRPQENFNVGRNFRINERVNVQFRGEFVNIFNRTLMPSPSTMNPQNNVSSVGGIILMSGFGVINASATPGSVPGAATSPVLWPRTGTLILRVTF